MSDAIVWRLLSPSRDQVRFHAWYGEPLAGVPAPPASRFTAVGRVRFWVVCRVACEAGLRRPNVIPLVSGELGESPTATGPMRGRRSRRQALGDRGREPRALVNRQRRGAPRMEPAPPPCPASSCGRGWTRRTPSSWRPKAEFRSCMDPHTRSRANFRSAPAPFPAVGVGSPPTPRTP